LIKLNEDERTPIVEECRACGKEGARCTRIIKQDEDEEEYCEAFLSPYLKWKRGRCNLAPMLIVKEITKAINPLKASKRATKK